VENCFYIDLTKLANPVVLWRDRNHQYTQAMCFELSLAWLVFIVHL